MWCLQNAALDIIREGQLSKCPDMLLFNNQEATTHTPLHQIGPKQVQTNVKFMSYLTTCSDLGKSLCVQMDKRKAYM
jgi:hypothetical protein